MIQRHLRIYICLGETEISGCNLIHTFPPLLPQLLFSCALLRVQWPVTRRPVNSEQLEAGHSPPQKSIICLRSGRKTGLWLHFLILHTEGFRDFFLTTFTVLWGILLIQGRMGQLCLRHHVKSEFLRKRELLEISTKWARGWKSLFSVCGMKYPPASSGLVQQEPLTYLQLTQYSWMKGWINRERSIFVKEQ